MKKAIVTGVTARQAGSQNVKHFYVETPHILKALLERLGYSVEHRGVTWGEDLSSYDLILQGMTKICSLAAQVRHIKGAAWALTRHQEKTVMYYDDWASMATQQNMETMIRTFDKRMAFFRQSETIDEECSNGIRTMAQQFTDRRPFKAAFIPAFSWADPAKLVPQFPKTSKTVLWDPTSLTDIHLKTTEDWPGPRTRQWVSATLQDHSAWIKKQGVAGTSDRWPLKEYGNKRQGQEILGENEIRAVYKRSWGVLAPKYPAPAWWRARYYHAAEAKAILLCDYEDARLMDDCFKIQRYDVERKSDTELAQLAEQQAEWMMSRISPIEEIYAKFEEVIKG